MKVIIGYHGKGNFGDDLILKEYLALNKNETFLLFSYGEKLVFDNVLDVVFWTKSKYKNIFIFITALIKCKQVIWVGGTCFSEEDGIGGFNYMMLAVALAKNISYEYIGINKLKTRKSRFKAKLLLTKSKDVICRDSHSIQNYNEIIGKQHQVKPAKLEFDLGDAYLMKIRDDYKSKSTQGHLLIAWRDLTNYPKFTESIYQSLILSIKSIMHEYKSILIIDTDDSLDSTHSTKMFLDLKQADYDVIHLKELDIAGKLDAIATASLIITSRLHIAVAGSVFGIPTVAYNYSSKMEYQQSQNDYMLISEQELELSSLPNIIKYLC